jgi:hypothetical protein
MSLLAKASTPFSWFAPVPTSGAGTWDQLLPSQCWAPVLMACVVSFVLPTTHKSLLAKPVTLSGI